MVQAQHEITSRHLGTREADEGALQAWCSICRTDATLEPVPCEDGHGSDCPEWVCVACNYVLVFGGVVDDAGGRRRTAGAA